MTDHCQICGRPCSPKRAITLDYRGEPVKACPDCARTRMSSLNQQMRALRKERKAIGRQIGDVRPTAKPVEEKINGCQFSGNSYRCTLDLPDHPRCEGYRAMPSGQCIYQHWACWPGGFHHTCDNAELKARPNPGPPAQTDDHDATTTSAGEP